MLVGNERCLKVLYTYSFVLLEFNKSLPILLSDCFQPLLPIFWEGNVLLVWLDTYSNSIQSLSSNACILCFPFAVYFLTNSQTYH